LKDAKAMLEYMKEYLRETNNTDLQKVFKEMDGNKKGQVSMKDFTSYFHAKPNFKLAPSSTGEVFKMIDSEKKTSITLEQFKKAFVDKIDTEIHSLFTKLSKQSINLSDNSESLDIDSTWQLCRTLRDSTLANFKKDFQLQTVLDLSAFTKVIKAELQQKTDKIMKSLDRVSKNGKVGVKDLRNIMVEHQLGEDIDDLIRELDPKNSRVIG